MRISTLADRTGLTVDTIRYYERLGLLEAPRRTPGGFRDYDGRAVGALLFVQRAKALGFTLREIARLRTLAGDVDADAGAVRALAAQRLEAIEAELDVLRRSRDQLAALVSHCGGDAVARSACPILDAVRSGGRSPPPRRARRGGNSGVGSSPSNRHGGDARLLRRGPLYEAQHRARHPDP